MHTLASLRATPNSLTQHYRAFRVDERLLFTGHSHQAWPDVAAAAMQECFLDAARDVDDKWERAFRKADRVAAGYAKLLDDPDGAITLTASTHDAVVRLLSALPLRTRPRIVTTDGEFHSLDRQARRLAEEGVEVVRVPARPVDTLADRLLSSLDLDPGRTALVAVSSVLFQTSELVPGLGALASGCDRHGAALLVDTYHHLGAVPFSLRSEGLLGAFVTGGGYKYLQLGEGNCFLRTPAGCSLRPVITGWFAAFGALGDDRDDGPVTYGPGAVRFAGSTYDPVSHYRAAAVLDFFEREDLTPGFLREISQFQTAHLRRRFVEDGVVGADVTFASELAPDRLGGFVALRTARAGALQRALAAAGILTDARGDVLRIGPAPYTSERQLDAFADALRHLVRAA